MDIGMNIEVQGQKMDIEQGMALSGTMTLKLTLE
jgi:hypothetical protein